MVRLSNFDNSSIRDLEVGPTIIHSIYFEQHYLEEKAWPPGLLYSDSIGKSTSVNHHDLRHLNFSTRMT